jgi:hypothetical protein
LNREKNLCHYLILSAVPAARNLKPWSWEAPNLSALNAKAKTCKSRCQFLRIGALVILPNQGVRAAVQAVPAVQAPTAVHVINQELSVFSC